MTARVTLAEQIDEAQRWIDQRRRETADGRKLKVMSPAFAERAVAKVEAILKTLKWVEKHESAIKAMAASKGETR